MTYIVVVVGYVLMLLGISVYKSRSVKSAEDFMVAGRSVPVYMLVATLVCTWIGSGSLFGTAGLTFRTGLSELWFSAGAWVGILVIYMIAARVRRIAQYTLTDLLEKRYNQLAKVLGTITIIIAYMVIAGYQFKGGGRFIAILSDGSISPETGMIIAALVVSLLGTGIAVFQYKALLDATSGLEEFGKELEEGLKDVQIKLEDAESDAESDDSDSE